MRDRKPVKAWIAVGDTFSFGVLFAYGGMAIAPVSMGAISIGLFSMGAMAIGVLAAGGFGFGVWAVAPFAVGWQAFGDCAIAWDAAWGGRYAVAHHFALGGTAHAAQVNTDFVKDVLMSNPLFRFCYMKVNVACRIMLIWVWVAPMIISAIVQWWVVRKDSR